MTTYCCPMREKYLVGVVAENPSIPTPMEAADFIDFDLAHPDGKLVMRIKYCPFCGKMVTGDVRVQP